jgi:hypothetical protein
MSLKPIVLFGHKGGPNRTCCLDARRGGERRGREGGGRGRKRGREEGKGGGRESKYLHLV